MHTMSTRLASESPLPCMYRPFSYKHYSWRPPRHRLSNKAHIKAYKRYFPVSEPGEIGYFLYPFLANSAPANEWSAHYLLSSMRYNAGCGVLVPTSGQRQVVFDDMKLLCRQYFPDEYKEIQTKFAAHTEEELDVNDDLELEEELDDDREACVSKAPDQEKKAHENGLVTTQKESLQGSSVLTREDPEDPVKVVPDIEGPNLTADTPVDVQNEVTDGEHLVGAFADSDKLTASEEAKDHASVDQEAPVPEELGDE